MKEKIVRISKTSRQRSVLLLRLKMLFVFVRANICILWFELTDILFLIVFELLLLFGCLIFQLEPLFYVRHAVIFVNVARIVGQELGISKHFFPLVLADVTWLVEPCVLFDLLDCGS